MPPFPQAPNCPVFFSSSLPPRDPIAKPCLLLWDFSSSLSSALLPPAHLFPRVISGTPSPVRHPSPSNSQLIHPFISKTERALPSSCFPLPGETAGAWVVEWGVPGLGLLVRAPPCAEGKRRLKNERTDPGSPVEPGNPNFTWPSRCPSLQLDPPPLFMQLFDIFFCARY